MLAIIGVILPWPTMMGDGNPLSIKTVPLDHGHVYCILYTVDIQHYTANPGGGSQNTLSEFGNGYQCCHV
jgi:hypothetical protein